MNDVTLILNSVKLAGIMGLTFVCDTSVAVKLLIMNKKVVEGNWNKQKGKLKQKFANLTDDDLMFAEGKKDEMIGKLQIKLGKTKEELHGILRNL